MAPTPRGSAQGELRLRGDLSKVTMMEWNSIHPRASNLSSAVLVCTAQFFSLLPCDPKAPPSLTEQAASGGGPAVGPSVAPQKQTVPSGSAAPPHITGDNAFL